MQHSSPAATAGCAMIGQSVINVYTHDLAMGVLVGVIRSALHFGWKLIDITADLRASSLA